MFARLCDECDSLSMEICVSSPNKAAIGDNRWPLRLEEYCPLGHYALKAEFDMVLMNN